MKRTSKATGIRPEFRLWLRGDDPHEVFGLGKWRLLEAIRREGSLRAAAAKLDISYRKAWGDLLEAEKALNVVFLERRRGGSDGGETLLTEAGKKWLAEYERLHGRIEKAVERAFASWQERMKR